MSESRRLRVWALATFIAVSSTLFALLQTSDAGTPFTCEDNTDCNCNIDQQALGCDPASGAGGVCNDGNCDCNPGFIPPNCIPATATPTRTVTNTGVPTATPTKVSQGGGCTDTSQCQPDLFCSDDVCCNRPCDGPMESCDTPDHEGICTPDIAPAPAASPTGLFILIGALAFIGAIALLRRRATR